MTQRNDSLSGWEGGVVLKMGGRGDVLRLLGVALITHPLRRSLQRNLTCDTLVQVGILEQICV